MKDWFMTKMRIENGQCSSYHQYYQSVKFYDQETNTRPILSVEFQHKKSRMTKSYNEIPITIEIEQAFASFSYEQLASLNDVALEHGFVALEDDSGGIKYCNRDISVCNNNCCLHNICDLGTMRKMTQTSS